MQFNAVYLDKLSQIGNVKLRVLEETRFTHRIAIETTASSMATTKDIETRLFINGTVGLKTVEARDANIISVRRFFEQGDFQIDLTDHTRGCCRRLVQSWKDSY
jgi:hypothetical protein